MVSRGLQLLRLNPRPWGSWGLAPTGRGQCDVRGGVGGGEDRVAKHEPCHVRHHPRDWGLHPPGLCRAQQPRLADADLGERLARQGRALWLRRRDGPVPVPGRAQDEQCGHGVNMAAVAAHMDAAHGHPHGPRDRQQVQGRWGTTRLPGLSVHGRRDQLRRRHGPCRPGVDSKPLLLRQLPR